MEKYYNILQKWILVFLSMHIMALAIIFFLSANLGSDPLTIFEDGLTRFLSISLGEASLLFNIIVIITAMVIGKKYLGIATIIYALMVGYVIDLWYPLQNLLEPMKESSYYLRFIFLFIAQNFMCIGFALLVSLKLGMSCFDAVIYSLEDKTKLPYKYIRIVFDVSLMLLGCLCGATLGFGTLFSMRCTGYMIPFYARNIEWILSVILTKKTYREN